MHIDDYKRAEQNINALSITEENQAQLMSIYTGGKIKQQVCIEGARTILREALIDLGLRSETVYTEDNKIVFEMEPGGIPEYLKAMLQKRKQN